MSRVELKRDVLGRVTDGNRGVGGLGGFRPSSPPRKKSYQAEMSELIDRFYRDNGED